MLKNSKDFFKPLMGVVFSRIMQTYYGKIFFDGVQKSKECGILYAIIFCKEIFDLFYVHFVHILCNQFIIAALSRSVKSIKSAQFHNFHILKPNALPFMTSVFVYLFVFSFLIKLFLNDFMFYCLIPVYFFSLLFPIVFWWFYILDKEIKEHTSAIRFNLKFGFFLFIISEVMFFFSFFWAYFHSGLSSTYDIGYIWPPVGFNFIIVYPFELPLLNTIILLTSGCTITAVHYNLESLILFYKKHSYMYLRIFVVIVFFKKKFINIKESLKINFLTKFKEILSIVKHSKCLNLFFKSHLNEKTFKFIKTFKTFVKYYWINISFKFCLLKKLLYGLFTVTLVLGLFFTYVQFYEYKNTSIFLSDSIFGSCFYILTGFHGFHVFVGTFLLLISFVQLFFNQFEDGYFLGFECAIWYWHFVDIVWLFLFIFVYVWPYALSISNKKALCIFYSSFLTNYVINYADRPLSKQIFFQDPATPIMESIIELHNYIMFYDIIIFFFVLYWFIATFRFFETCRLPNFLPLILISSDEDDFYKTNFIQFETYLSLHLVDFIDCDDEIFESFEEVDLESSDTETESDGETYYETEIDYHILMFLEPFYSDVDDINYTKQILKNKKFTTLVKLNNKIK